MAAVVPRAVDEARCALDGAGARRCGDDEYEVWYASCDETRNEIIMLANIDTSMPPPPPPPPTKNIGIATLCWLAARDEV